MQAQLTRAPDISGKQASFKKVLLLSDIPPCKNLTAGLVLHQLCSMMPEGSVACYAVVHPELDAKLEPDLSWIPVEYAIRPRENKKRRLPGKLGALECFLAESYTEHVSIKRIAKLAVAFGRKFGAEAIWCVVEGQSMMRLATEVADLLKVPLLTQVWDPPTWWLRANKVDNWSCKRILDRFALSMRRSERLAAASWAMAEEYGKLYGCSGIPVIPSLDEALAKPPAERLSSEDELVIGMAGQLYSDVEWEHLLLMLNSIDWRFRGRQVVIKLLGRLLKVHTASPVRIDYLGWRNQRDTIDILSRADILYCPYWFDPTYRAEASFSFPSKLTTYLAAGRPVLFHGPEYASPARFLKEHDAASFCHDLANSAIFNSIDRLVSDQEYYRSRARNGSAAFHEHLTTRTMRRQFAKFLDVSESDLKGS